MNREKKCLLCCGALSPTKIDFGKQPISSHFTEKASSKLLKKTISLTICADCETIQLLNPIPWKELIPPFEWITYREPEEHLDDLVENLTRFISEEANILGLSFKDQTLLERLNKKGYLKTEIFSLTEHNQKLFPTANIESVPPLFAERIRTKVKNEVWDVIVARHVIEHAERPRDFLCALVSCLSENGVLVIEVPDCDRNLKLGDLAMVWEEHVTYFTKETLQNWLNISGFETLFLRNYPLPFESCLVFFIQKDHSELNSKTYISNKPETQMNTFEKYVDQVKTTQTKIRQKLMALRETGLKIAIYGAGHLSANFINFNGFHDLIEAVIDDDSKKQGLYFPGTKLRIQPPHFLLEENINICLLGLSIELEEKIIKKNYQFEKRGGVFFSILKASSRSIV